MQCDLSELSIQANHRDIQLKIKEYKVVGVRPLTHTTLFPRGNAFLVVGVKQLVIRVAHSL